MDTPVGIWWLAALVFVALNGGSLVWALRAYRRRDRWLQARLAERTRELEEAYDQLRRKERLAAVGELAGALA